MPYPVRVLCDDVAAVAVDVLFLKFAQAFYGADAYVFSLLDAEPTSFRVPPGQHKVFRGNRMVKAECVAFLGTPSLSEVRYAEIRKFSSRALQLLPELAPTARSIAMTIHGVGYGLDEREAFLSQLGGIADAWDARRSPNLEDIVIVERDARRAKRLQDILEEATTLWSSPESEKPTRKRIDAGTRSEQKPHVFVAMPFRSDMEDTFEFGILEPVRAAGLLCERVDMAVFSGDILQRIKERIGSAAFVVADLTGGNANVYLEVGYAWGKGKVTYLIAKEGEELKFDAKTQRCIFYKSIKDLKSRITNELPALLKNA